MKELKKLKLSTFTYELKKKELGQIVGGGKQNTDTYGHTTSQSKSDKDSASGDWQRQTNINPCQNGYAD